MTSVEISGVQTHIYCAIYTKKSALLDPSELRWEESGTDVIYPRIREGVRMQ